MKAGRYVGIGIVIGIFLVLACLGAISLISSTGNGKPVATAVLDTQVPQATLPIDTPLDATPPIHATLVGPMVSPDMSVQDQLLCGSMTPQNLAGVKWGAYQNTKYGFTFRFPPCSYIYADTDESADISLPFAQGTNLMEKYLELSVSDGGIPCKSPSWLIPGVIYPKPSPELLSINNSPFLKETGADAGMGKITEATAYSTLKGNACISFTFVLRYRNEGFYSAPLAAFNKKAESEVFSVIMASYTNP